MELWCLKHDLLGIVQEVMTEASHDKEFGLQHLNNTALLIKAEEKYIWNIILAIIWRIN